MNKKIFLSRILVLTVGISLCLSAQAVEEKYIPGELLVKFNTENSQKIDNAIKAIGAKIAENLPRIGVSRLKLPSSMSIEKAGTKLKELGIVKYAQPNYVLKHFGDPNDQYFGKQWALKKINAQRGWGIKTGSKSVVIAIVDTGVDLNHPDLKNNVIAGYDFVDNDSEPLDTEGHGTHCAGIAAALANNGVGVAGVCPNCSIMPVKVLSGWSGSSSNVANGIIWAADHGAQVISMSLGGPYHSYAIEDAIRYAVSKGALPIAAAGNDHTNSPSYPAYQEECIAVGSTGKDDSQSKFSNFGNWVDVAAPGDAIISTVPNALYEYKSGTSMATPHVAGLAGLLFGCKGANASKVRQAIESSSKSVGNWVRTGRIDVYQALTYLGCQESGTIGGNTGGSTVNNGTETGLVQKETGPSGYGLTFGKIIAQPSNSLVKSDDQRLVLKAKGKGYNNELDFYVSAKNQSSQGAKKLSVQFEAGFTNPGEITVYFYDWQGNKWDWIGKEYLDANEKTIAFERDTPKAYISEAGEIRVRFYRQSKRWEQFDIEADYIRFTVTREYIDETTGDSQKSMKDKAKDLWNRLR